MKTIGKGKNLARFCFRDGVEVLVRYDIQDLYGDHSDQRYVLSDASKDHPVTVPMRNVLYVEWDVGEEKTDA